MRNKYLRWSSIIIGTPIALFLLLCVLVYLPPIQNYLVRKVTEYASEKTGMHIRISSVALRFPLNLAVHQLLVSQKNDTIFNLQQANVDVQLIPLFRQQIEIDAIQFLNGTFNSASLIKGMHIKADVGSFTLDAHGISLPQHIANINHATLSKSKIQIAYADTTTADTTEKAPIKWKINLHNIRINQVDIDYRMPLDTLSIHATINNSQLKKGTIDLEHNKYLFKDFSISDSKLKYDAALTPDTVRGLDPTHISLTEVGLHLDSVFYSPEYLKVNIRSLRMLEKSGIRVLSSNGIFSMDDKQIDIPGIELRTADSFIALSTRMGLDIANPGNNAIVEGRLLAEIGKGDLLRLIPQFPSELAKEYPSLPLRIHAGIDGKMKNFRLTSLNISLPKAFRLAADGDFVQVADSLHRKVSLRTKIEVENLDFIQAFTGGFRLPESSTFEAHTGIKGQAITAEAELKKGDANLKFLAAYHLGTEAYQGQLNISRLNINDFLPGYSLYTLTTDWSFKGQGIDFFSPKTTLELEGGIAHVRYDKQDVNNFLAKINIADGKLQGQLDLNDATMGMSSALKAQLSRQQIQANINLNIFKADLQAMNLVSVPLNTSENLTFSLTSDLKNSHRLRGNITGIRIMTSDKTYRPKDIHFGLSTVHDSIRSFVNAGDLTFMFRTAGKPDYLSKQLDKLKTAFGKQWEARAIDQAALRKLLPSADFRIIAGTDNPLANFLATKQLYYERINVNLNSRPTTGLNGSAYLIGFHTDSLHLDSIYLETIQDPQRLLVHGGVKAGNHKGQEAYAVNLNGEIASSDGQVFVEYLNGKGQRGAYIGLKAVLETGGIRFHITPDNPTLVYRTFKANPDNYIFLSKTGRIDARLQLHDENYTGLEVYSTPDSLAQQDMTVALHKINIDEFRRIIPYMPEMTGIIDAEAHYIDSGKESQFTGDINISNFSYNKQQLGNWSMSGVYLPKETGEHKVDGFISMNDRTIAKLNGSYFAPLPGKKQGALSSDMTLIRFPLQTINSFIPDRMVVMDGNLNGTMTVVGSTDKLLMNGEVGLDSISMRIPAASMNLHFDNRPVEITDSRINFDNYRIYTSGENPFIIQGYFDFKNFNKPYTDLKMQANDFELVNSRKTRESLVFGKLFVDFNSTLRGSMDNLSLRGNMNVLGKSDFTYIMKDSPMSVEDRLGQTVTFTNFKDTTQQLRLEQEEIAFNMNILMNMHIDEGVQCRVNLTPNGSNYMALEGGGDLSFQYRQNGKMFLNGRYTLISGEMKYEMPVIPLKTFHIKGGSYVEWMGNLMNPRLNIQASERVRASVANDEKSSRMVNFDVGVDITNQLQNLGFTFTLDSPDDAGIQNELATKTAEERNKLAVTMLVTGMYMSETNSGVKGLSANSALNSLLQSEINNLAGNAFRSVDLNVGMETSDNDGDGNSQTDYNFQFAKRFWNNRIRVVIGGKISTGNNVQQDQSFIDNIALEYRLDDSGTRYIRLFHNKNYESVLDGEVIETGVGLVLQRKVSRLGDLFIFRKKKKNNVETEN